MGENDRPNVELVGEEVRYRASSLGSCIRALAAARQGMEPWHGETPAGVQKAWDRGNEAEEVAVKALVKKGYTVEERQKEVRLVLTPRLVVVGHIDFYTYWPKAQYPEVQLVDVKRQNDDEFAKPSIRDSIWWKKYEWQFASYMLADNFLQMQIVRINDQGEMKGEVVELPHTRAEILARVLAVEAMAAKDLTQEACTSDDFPCPFFHRLHPREAEEVREVEDERLGSIALHYKRLSVEESEAGKRRKELREELIKAVGQGKVRETVSGIVISVTSYSTKEKVIPAGGGTRVNVVLPGDEGEGDGQG